MLFLLSCSKSSNSNSSTSSKPLKAVLNATVSGMTITITADKSEGDVCAYGFDVYGVDTTLMFHATFSPGTSQQGQKNTAGTGYVSGTLTYIPLSATVDKKADYHVALEVLDSKRDTSWAYTIVTVK